MELRALDAADLYVKMMGLMRGQKCITEDSRNGEVYSLPQPLLVTVQRPDRRVLLDPVRNCNPFFHVAEIVWMMSGGSKVDWLSQFNSRMKEYAGEDGKIHGAYGRRWRRWFTHGAGGTTMDQIHEVVSILRKDPGSRRACVAMWDADEDLGHSHADLPCNTHIYLRVVKGRLNMTVCNRSNDVVWGMCGANIVHMTALQELLALELDLRLGTYHVMTNNAHVYRELPKLGNMLRTKYVADAPGTALRLLHPNQGETLGQFMADCENMVDGKMSPPVSTWLKTVADPMIDVYLSGGRGGHHIGCPHWRQAALEWLQRNRGELK